MGNAKIAKQSKLTTKTVLIIYAIAVIVSISLIILRNQGLISLSNKASETYAGDQIPPEVNDTELQNTQFQK